MDVRVFPNNERFRKHFAEQVLQVKARYACGKLVVSADSEFTRSSVIHDLGEAEEVELYGPLAPRQTGIRSRACSARTRLPWRSTRASGTCGALGANCCRGCKRHTRRA